MDVQLFQNWFFEKFVPHVKKFVRKSSLPEYALLLVDSAPSHPATTSLQYEDIIKFLFPNMTSIVQPMSNCILQMKLSKESSRNFASLRRKRCQFNELFEKHHYERHILRC